MINKKVCFALFCLLIIVFSGCKGPPKKEQYFEAPDIFDASLPDGKLQFEQPVLPLDRLDHIIPLGSLNPPDHTFPTVHHYWVDYNPQKPEQPPPEVFAPVGGKILEIKEFNENDHGIQIGVTNTKTYYIYHLNLNPSYQVGDTVSTGEKLGVRSQMSIGIDLGVLNKDVYNDFINVHYPLGTYHADGPLKYFSGNLQSQLYAKVRAESESSSGPDLDGKLNYDLPGTLSGNWWLKDTVLYYADEQYGRKQLAFAYDNIYQDEISISVGKNLDHLFEDDRIISLFYVQPGATPPEAVEPGETVAYYLYDYRYTEQHPERRGDPQFRLGLMMVQMLSADQIKVEIFIDTEGKEREFTTKAWEYKR